MQINLLGPTQVRESGRTIAIAGSRMRALLTLLAIDAGTVVGRADLIAGIWPDEQPSKPINALDAVVQRLRRPLPKGTLKSKTDGYLLAVPTEAVDINRFTQLITEADAALAATPDAACALYDEALSLWRSEPFPDVAHLPSVRSETARLTDLRMEAVEQRAALRLTAENALDVIDELRTVLATHPLRQRSAEVLIQALQTAGHHAEALRTFAAIQDALAEQHIALNPDLASAHDALLDDTSPPVERRIDEGHLVPPPQGSFVGRQSDARHVRDLLTRSRLVSLTGPSGVGKTRLAIEVARSGSDQWTDGSRMVDLPLVTNPAHLTYALILAIGLEERRVLGSPQAPASADLADPLRRLLAGLGDRHVLLVLDDYRQMSTAVGPLVEHLIDSCPNLRVLATGPEPLDIAGEAVHTVEPLAVPPEGADIATAAASPAVQLLADRAAVALPGFTVDETNVASLTQLSRTLEGLPQALELAAGRLRLLGPSELADQVTARFSLLPSGDTTDPDRRWTLQAMLAWTWDVLGEEERRLWRRLSIVTGGATLEMIDHLLPDIATPVLDLVTKLVDLSVLVIDSPRVTMSRSARVFGLTQLAAAHEGRYVQRAHATYVLNLYEEAEPHLRSHEQLDWLRRMDAERHELRTAVRWAIDEDEAEIAARLVAAASVHWWLGGHRVEGAAIADTVIDLVEEHRHTLQPSVLARLYACGGGTGACTERDMTTLRARYAKAVRLAAIAVSQGCNDPTVALLVPMVTQLTTGDERPLLHLADQEDGRDPALAATARLVRASTLVHQGRPAQIGSGLTAALDGFRRVGDRWGLAMSLALLAELDGRAGQHPRAAERYHAAIEHITELGAVDDLPGLQAALGHQLALAGRQHDADATLADAQQQARTPEGAAIVEHALGDAARVRGDLAAARQHINRSIALLDQADITSEETAAALTTLALLDAADGEHAAALEGYHKALGLAVESEARPLVARAVVGVADLALRSDKPRRAAALLGAATAIRGSEDRSLLDAVRIASAARQALGETFVEAFREGKTLYLEAIHYAVSAPAV